jgi:hypothetical protein
MPPVNSVLARHCLKLRKLPVERIAAHGLKQLRGSVHRDDDTAGNITAQVWYVQMSRAFELSGSVARDLSGRHSEPKGVSYEADGAATGDPEDEIR